MNRDYRTYAQHEDIIDHWRYNPEIEDVPMQEWLDCGYYDRIAMVEQIVAEWLYY